MSTLANPSSLLLTLEPEAAVLAVAANEERHAAGAPAETKPAPSSSTARPAKPRLSPEDVVLVLDCGGGTVDLTLARVYGTGRRTRLEEEAVGRGGQGPRECLGVGMLALCPSALTHKDYHPCPDAVICTAPRIAGRLPLRGRSRLFAAPHADGGGAVGRVEEHAPGRVGSAGGEVGAVTQQTGLHDLRNFVRALACANTTSLHSATTCRLTE